MRGDTLGVSSQLHTAEKAFIISNKAPAPLFLHRGYATHRRTIMAKEIRFLDQEIDFDHGRKSVLFPALVDGKRVRCVVSATLLAEKFRAASE